MSFGDVATRGEDQALSDRLSLGVAARLSRYLQVLTQARKMGKETISSQELSEYTHVNSTQIRRDLSLEQAMNVATLPGIVGPKIGRAHV